jgi:hypothetical protein
MIPQPFRTKGQIPVNGNSETYYSFERDLREIHEGLVMTPQEKRGSLFVLWRTAAILIAAICIASIVWGHYQHNAEIERAGTLMAPFVLLFAALAIAAKKRAQARK